MPKMSKIVESILNIKHHEYVDDIQKRLMNICESVL